MIELYEDVCPSTMGIVPRGNKGGDQEAILKYRLTKGFVEPYKKKNLRRVDLALLSKRGFDLVQKCGVSLSLLVEEVWIDVEEGRSINFYKENNASMQACLGGARSQMLGFPELVAAFVRAADDTAKPAVNLYPMRRETEYTAAAAAPPPLKRQPSVRRFMKCEECHKRKPDVHEVCGGGWVVCNDCRFSSEED
jgi:hypothetical protein